MDGVMRFCVTVDGDGMPAQGTDGESAILVVSGELDVATCPVLRRAIDNVLDTGRADLVIDLGAVRFIDAMGIRVLIQAAEEARNADGGLVLRKPRPAVRRLLGLLQLTGMLAIEE
jgi:anti-anti-sigma factor